MAKSKSINQWQELVKSCNESGLSKAAFSITKITHSKSHQMCPISLKWIKKFF